MARLFVVFIVSLCFSGCSTTRQASVNEALIVPGTLPAAVPVEGLPFSFLHQQLIGTFSAGETGGKRQIQVAVERQGDSLEFVALSGAGLQLYKVSYNGTDLVATKSVVLPDAFSPWQIVSDFMAVYADENTLNKAIGGKGWEAQAVTNDTKKWERTIRNAQGLPVMQVVCAGSDAQSCYRRANLNNFQLNYGLTVNTLAYENNNETQQGRRAERAAQPEHSAQRQHALGRVGRIARRPLRGSRPR